MAKKKINLGQVGIDGDRVSVAATVDDDTLGPGAATNFFLTIYRAEGEAINSLTIWSILFGATTLDLYPPYDTTGNARVLKLSARQSKKIPFLIDNAPEGEETAAYYLLSVIQWDEHPPYVLELFTIP